MAQCEPANDAGGNDGTGTLTGSQIALAVRQADAGLPPHADDRRFEHISFDQQNLDRAAAVLVAVGVGTAAPTDHEDLFLVRKRVERILDVLRIPYQRQAEANGALTA